MKRLNWWVELWKLRNDLHDFNMIILKQFDVALLIYN